MIALKKQTMHHAMLLDTVNVQGMSFAFSFLVSLFHTDSVNFVTLVLAL